MYYWSFLQSLWRILTSKIQSWGFGFRFELIFSAPPAASKMAHYSKVVKIDNKNYLVSKSVIWLNKYSAFSTKKSWTWQKQQQQQHCTSQQPYMHGHWQSLTVATTSRVQNMACLAFSFFLFRKKVFSNFCKRFFFTFAVKDSEFASSSGKTGLGKNLFFILIRLRSIKYNYSRITT